MTTTRVLVAHDAGARVFDHRGLKSGLVELESIDFEDGRRSLTDINEDKPGRVMARGGGGRAFEPHEDPRTRAVQLFAKKLVEDLTRAHHRGEFTRLVLVAPPRFLGHLRDALSPTLERTVIATIAKDLPRATIPELNEHLKPYVGAIAPVGKF